MTGTEVSVALTRLGFIVVISAFVVQAPSTMQGAIEDSSWQSVRKIPHGADFVFIDRNLSCKTGQVQSSSEKNLTVRVDGSDIVLEKADLLRVQRRKPSADSYVPLSVVYSGRSSWADIKDFMPFLSTVPSYEVRLAVVTTQGKK